MICLSNSLKNLAIEKVHGLMADDKNYATSIVLDAYTLKMPLGVQNGSLGAENDHLAPPGSPTQSPATYNYCPIDIYPYKMSYKTPS